MHLEKSKSENRIKKAIQVLPDEIFQNIILDYTEIISQILSNNNVDIVVTYNNHPKFNKFLKPGHLDAQKVKWGLKVAIRLHKSTE